MSLDFSLQTIEVAPDRKRMRHGKARVLNEKQLGELFEALPTDRDRSSSVSAISARLASPRLYLLR